MKRTKKENKLKKMRIARGLTQEELAALSGLCIRSITRLEQGNGCTRSTLKAIAKALKCKEQDLIDD